MKKFPILFLSAIFLLACNNEKKDDVTTGKPSEVKSLASISLPYEVQYKDLTPGDPNHAKLVLDFFKLWDNNRLSDGKPMLNDSVAVDFADGTKFAGTADSLIAMGNKFRSNYSSIKTTIDACMSVRSDSKNEDWVLVWDKTYKTDQKGKIDSLNGHSYWMIKNGKIAFWGELEAKLAPASSTSGK